MIVDTERMGINEVRRRLNVVMWGREEWGVLDMNPGFAGKLGDRMREFKCRHWGWLHSIVKDVISPNCIN